MTTRGAAGGEGLAVDPSCPDLRADGLGGRGGASLLLQKRDTLQRQRRVTATYAVQTRRTRRAWLQRRKHDQGADRLDLDDCHSQTADMELDDRHGHGADLMQPCRGVSSSGVVVAPASLPWRPPRLVGSYASECELFILPIHTY